jgi:hypothetical protein
MTIRRPRPPSTASSATPQQASERRRRLGMWALIGFWLATVWLWAADLPVDAAGIGGLSVVKRGAHLLSLEPEDGSYPRVAYLPVGTIVEPTGRIERISVKSGLKRPFEAVITQSGASGFLRTSLFTSIDDARLAVPVSSTELPLFYQPLSSFDNYYDDDKETWVCPKNVCLLFSRTGGVYMTIDEDVGDYYQVTLHRTLTKVEGGPDLAKEENNRFLPKDFVQNGLVEIIDRSSAAESMTTWNRDKVRHFVIDPEAVTKLLEKIKSSGETIKESTIWCNSVLNASGELGFDVWFAKANLAGSITTKEKDRFQMAEQVSEQVSQGSSSKPIVYDLYRDIECKNADPERTTRLIVEIKDGKKQMVVDLDQLKSVSCETSPGKGCENWIRLKKEGEPFDKMVVVSDWPSYNAVLGQLEAAGGKIAPTNIGNDPQIQRRIVERENLYDFILREIAIFRDPD